MRKTVRYLLWLTGLFLLLLVGSLLILPKVLDFSPEIPMLEARLTDLTGRRVTIERLSLDLTHGVGLRAGEVSIRSASGDLEFAHLHAATFVVRILPYVLDDKIEIAGVLLDEPIVRLRRSGSASNIDDLIARFSPAPAPAAEGEEAPAAAPVPLSEQIQKALQAAPIEFLEIDHGRITYVSKPADGEEPEASAALPVLSAGPNHSEIADLKLHIGPLRPFTPVEFELSTEIRSGGSRPARIDIDGNWTFHEEDFRIAGSQLNARTSFTDLDWGWFHNVKPIADLGLERGVLSGQFHLTGNPADHFVVDGRLDGDGVRGDWPSVWAVPFEPRSLHLPLEIERQGDLLEIRISNADINGMDVRWIRMGFFQGDYPEGEFGFAMDLDVRNAEWEKDFEFYPWNAVAPSVKDTLRERIARTGRCTKTNISFENHFHDGAMWAVPGTIRIVGALEDMKMRVGLGDKGPYLSNMNLTLVHENGGLFFRNGTARVDGTVDLGFDGGFANLRENSLLELELDGAVPIAGLATVLPKYAFPAFGRQLAPLRSARGLGTARAKMGFDFETGDYSYEGKLDFSRLAFDLPDLGLQLSSLEGSLNFSPDRVETTMIRGRSGKSEVRFSIAIEDPQGKAPTFEASFNGEDLDLKPMMSALGGAHGYSAQGKISIRDFFLRAPSGEDAGPPQLSGSVHLKQTSLKGPFLSRPIEDLNCIFLLSRDGRNDFGCQALLGASDFKLSGAITSSEAGIPSGRLEAESLYVDVEDLSSSLNWSELFSGAQLLEIERERLSKHLDVDEEVADGVRVDSVEVAPPEKGNALGLELPPSLSPTALYEKGNFEIALSAASFHWKSMRGRDLIADVAARKGVVNFGEVSYQGPGGQHRFERGYVAQRLEGGFRIAMEPRLEGLDAGPFLTWLGLSKGTVEGTLDSTGALTCEGSTPDQCLSTLSGPLRIRASKGRVANVKNLKVLAQILTLLHWKGLDSYEDGIPYNQIAGDFVLNHGVAHTDGLIFESPKFDISSSGDIDFNSQRVKMLARVKISEPLDFAINQIPVVNRLAGNLAIPIPIRGTWRELDVRLEE
ncbi:MAG: AsmA family protein [Chrysiogenetes bacterium]|nr:AsmA family protein [Chrysiogenetes bacterium]